MWNLFTGIAIGVIASTILFAWFVRWFVRSSKPSEELPPATHHVRPATIQVHNHPDPNSWYRCTLHGSFHDLREADPGKLSDVELNTAAFVRWCIVTKGMYSEG
jgi:hypothetical protein